MADMKSILKKGLMLYAGVLGMRVLGNVIKTYVTDKYLRTNATFASGMGAKLLPVIPSALGWLVSVFLAPKIVKKPELVNMLQMGATIALADAVVANFIKPSLPPNVAGLLGIDGGYGGYGLGSYVTQPMAGYMGQGQGEYVDYDNRLGEFGEYVGDNRYGGFDVSEGLGAEELAFMNTGGAGGSLSKTSLGY